MTCPWKTDGPKVLEPKKKGEIQISRKEVEMWLLAHRTDQNKVDKKST